MIRSWYADTETKLPAILEDLKDAHEWIRKAGPAVFQADPDRIIVVGHSAGGYLALMAGSVLTPPPRALVSFYGYGDISGNWCNQPDAYYSQQSAVSKEAAQSGDQRRGSYGGFPRGSLAFLSILPPAGPLGKGGCGRTG